VVRARRAPRSLAEALAAVRRDAAPPTLLAGVQAAWREAAGEAIARQATPVSERGGVVMVACKSATWAQELDLLQDELRRRLEERLPPSMVLRGLRFKVAEPS
jgi:predicted nucleic acid-binding Zn ribbon protein